PGLKNVETGATGQAEIQYDQVILLDITQVLAINAVVGEVSNQPVPGQLLLQSLGQLPVILDNQQPHGSVLKLALEQFTGACIQLQLVHLAVGIDDFQLVDIAAFFTVQLGFDQLSRLNGACVFQHLLHRHDLATLAQLVDLVVVDTVTGEGGAGGEQAGQQGCGNQV